MRTRIQALIELREIVTTLYKDKASIGRILSDAGLDVRRFNFEGNLIDVWHRILEDVENQECLPELIYAIQQEYPKNKTLQNAWRNYCQTVETKPSAGQLALDEQKRNEKRNLRVFLCHASKDKAIIRKLYYTLRRDGVDPWLDTENLVGGQDWQHEITRAVQQSDVILVCLSHKSNNSKGYIQEEIRFALAEADKRSKEEITIIPVRLESCNVPERFTRWQWIDLFDKDGYVRLLGSLNRRALQLSANIPQLQGFPYRIRRISWPLIGLLVITFAISIQQIILPSGTRKYIDEWFSPAPNTPPIVSKSINTPEALVLTLENEPLITPTPHQTIATVTTAPVDAVATDTVSAISTVTAVNPLDMAATWEDLQYYYQNGDWGAARWNMMTLLSAQYGIPGLAQSNISPAQQAQEIRDELLDEPVAQYWRQWPEFFTIDEVSQILADIYVGLANENIINAEFMLDKKDVTGPPGQTEDYLLAAVTILPNDDELRQLSSELSRYFLADEAERATHEAALSAAYVAYAASRDKNEAYCASLQAVTAAQFLLGEQISAEVRRGYGNACRAIVNMQTPTPIPNPWVGTLYYSSQSSDGYAIWRVPVDNPASAMRIINQGTQPSIYGNRVAFYNRQTGSEGLSGVALDETNILPNGPFAHYTRAAEDAKESPAKWNPGGNALVFSSADSGDGMPRLYIAPAAFDSDKQSISLGQDPVWSPDGTQILYHDRGEDGHSPGLFLRPAGGGEASRLTGDEDRRPIWTSDGKYIIFMRLVDGTNWDLFRMTVADGTTVRLTSHPAQDGIPAINPTGNTVLFASDRGRSWNLWTISLTKSEYVTEDSARFDVTHGEAEFLMPIQGAFLNWLEHSIQWVN